MRTSTEILIKSLRILVDDIKTDDGVANACIFEASVRIEEQKTHIEALTKALAASLNMVAKLCKQNEANVAELKSIVEAADEAHGPDEVPLKSIREALQAWDEILNESGVTA